MELKSTIIIPARLSSIRLPEKALCDIFGKSMIMRVYQRACAARLATEVIVATDHPKIFDHVMSAGGYAVMTSPSHQSGTDRIAEVAVHLSSDIIINLQGDEPLVHPEQIDELIAMMQNPDVAIGTQCQKIDDPDILFDYNVVKVVRTYDEKALYFSRQVLPAVRDKGYDQWFKDTEFFRHIGIYGFKKQVLLELTKLPVSGYEKVEALEQLRWLQNGFEIYCKPTEYSSIGVDTPDDLEAVREIVFKEMFR